jgi:dCTP deaminase
MVLGNSFLPYFVSGDAHIGNSSIDLRLHEDWLAPVYDPYSCKPFVVGYDNMEYKDMKGDLVIRPGQFVLARTEEILSIPIDHIGWIEGRSSIGRLGLFVQNAGFVDAGFCGSITLELYNSSEVDMVVPVGYRIAQLVIAEAKGVTYAYSGKYQGQIKPTGYRRD